MRVEDFNDLPIEDTASEIRPRNPPEPPEGNRESFVLTFDNGFGDTRGMLDALREAGYWAKSSGWYPRTTILVRTAQGAPVRGVRTTIAANLYPNGSAVLASISQGMAFVWPERAWPGEAEKRWRRFKE